MFTIFLFGILASAHAAVFPETTSKSFSYRQVAENTTEIRWYVTPGKKTDTVQTTEDFTYQYEVVHAQDTYLTANVTEAFRSYYQVYTYHEDDLMGWNDSAAPFTVETPLPSKYHPMALTRHIWTSMEAFNASFETQGYQNQTASHIFCRLDQYGSVLTPLAKLAWDPERASFMDIDRKTKDSSMYVGLLLGDSTAGTAHDEIYETLELRRAYVESRLHAQPELAVGLLNFVQNGKSLQTSMEGGKAFMDSLQANSPFTSATFWEHVALEEYWFDSPRSATAFFNGLPKLGSLLWQGSAGSYTIAGVPSLIFEKDAKRL